MLAASQTAAAKPPETCKVLMLATLNNQPALKPTVMTIRHNGQIVLQNKASSFTTTALECWGSYTATISTDVSPTEKITRTRTFTVLTANNIVVAMDPK